MTSQPILSELVDTPSRLNIFLHHLTTATNNPTLPPTLFLDLEGIKLSRHGQISLLTLLIQIPNHPPRISILDIHTLGSIVFTTPLPSNTNNFSTLKTILESPLVKKVFFDVRNDSDALFAHFGIRMQGVVDLQLMEHLSRHSGAKGKKFLHGLSRCVAMDSNLSLVEKREWESAKEEGMKLFAPEKGGRYEVFNERPLRGEIKTYCEVDVSCLPGLYEVYRRKLDADGRVGWEEVIWAESERRVVESVGSGYVPNGAHKALAPVW